MLELWVFVGFAIAAGTTFWFRTGTFFSPPVLVSFSLAGASSFALLFDAQVKFGADLHAGFTAPAGPVAVIYGAGLIGVLIPWWNQGPVEGPPPYVEPNIWTTTFLLATLTVVLLLVTWGLLGNIPLLGMLGGNQSIDDHLLGLKALPLGLMLANLMAATVLALYFASVSSLEELSTEEWISLFILAGVLSVAALWQGNRQMVLIIVFFCFARYFLRSRYDRTFVTPKRVLSRSIIMIVSALLFVAAFTAVNYIRLSALGRFSGPSELFLYYSWPVYNMASIHAHTGFGGFGDPSFIFTEILPARLGGKDLVADIAPLLFEPTSPSGYFSYWYLSYGLLGVSLGGLVLGAASRWSFQRSLKSESWAQLYILVLWTCATVSIYSHFITTAFFFAPLVFLLLVQALSKMRFSMARFEAS